MLKRIKIIDPNDSGQYHDARRIVRVLADHGYLATEEQAIELWQRHSEAYAAGWLGLPENDYSLFLDLRYYFEGVE